MKNYYSILSLIILMAIVLGCSFSGSKRSRSAKRDSPETAYRNFNKAIQSTDTELMKSLMSKGTKKMMREAAKKKNMSLDDFLLAIRIRRKYEPKLRNEKITGNTAIIEEYDPAYGKWEKVYLILEDDRWKYAGDTTLKEKSKRLSGK